MRVIVVTMRGWSDVGLWVAVCSLAKIFVHIYNHVCTIDTVTGNLAVNSVFITFRSMRETQKFHFFLFFKTLFVQKLYRFLYHGDQKISWWRIYRWQAGRSTLKSTCADPALSLTAFGDRPASGMSKLSASVNSDLGNGSFWLEIMLSM